MLSDISTLSLLKRARAGDEVASDLLFQSHLPRINRWAHGRLPQWARQGLDTSDLVQDAASNAFRHLNRFEYRGSGSFAAFFRLSVLNKLRDHMRRVRPAPMQVTDAICGSAGPTALDTLSRDESVRRCRRAIQQLRPLDRQLIRGRFEAQLSFVQLAEHIGMHSPDAARIAVTRAVLRLARAISEQ
jgi:RNA polymerase sigma-70 factor (ECF subfamily)